MHKKYPLFKKILCSFDVMVIILAANITMNLAKRYFLTEITNTQYWHKLAFLSIMGISYVYIFHKLYLYKLDIITTRNKQLVLLTKSLLYSMPMFILTVFFINGKLNEGMRSVILIYFPVIFVLFAIERMLFFRNIYKRLMRKGRLHNRILVIGAGEAARLFAARAESDTDLGLEIAGFMDDDPQKIGIRIFNKIVLGKIDSISPDLLAQYKVNKIFIAINFITHDKLLSIIKNCRKFKLPINLVTKHFNIIDEVAGISHFDAISYTIFDSFKGATLFYVFGKRFFDIIASIVLLIILLPAFLIIASLIKVTSPGPVFYKPIMVGKGGGRFRMYKFRSMYSDCDKEIHKELVREVIEGKRSGEKLKNDKRVTRIGGFLRRCSLDELPQLFNVLLGHMSIVGPRPCIPYEVDMYKKWHKARFSVRPGITGLWQVYGRGKVLFDDMVVMDIYYIRNRTAWMDYSILLRTVPVVFSGIGAG